MLRILIIFAIILTAAIILFAGVLYWITKPDSTREKSQISDRPDNEENHQIKAIADNLQLPWELRITDNGVFLFTQKQTGLFKLEEGSTVEIYKPDDLYARGEGGMMGLELVNNFTDSRQLFTCFNSEQNGDYQIIVSKLTLDQDLTAVTNRQDIITGIPANVSGRHSGCRLKIDNQNQLWITTGDAADEANPQNPDSLGGKILRTDLDGNPVEGNLNEPFDPRIFSYGHRNTQGIVFLPYSPIYGYGYTSEHGPNVNDEINPLLPGNFGWNPGTFYNESVPMTDTARYPGAIEAAWESGNRTIAASGLVYVVGEQWGEWNDSLLLAALKDSYILRLTINENGSLTEQEKIISGYGRIRQVYQSTKGDLYFITDNGNNKDIIAQIIPPQ